MSKRDELAEVLAKHEADVTSYDAGDIHGCECGWELPPDLANRWDDKWPAYYAHVADALRQMLADAWDEGYEAGGEDERDAYWDPGNGRTQPNPYRTTHHLNSTGGTDE